MDFWDSQFAVTEPKLDYDIGEMLQISPNSFEVLSLLGYRTLGKVADNGQAKHLLLCGLNHHPNPCAENDDVHKSGHCAHRVRTRHGVDDWLEYPINHQPHHEQIKTLKSMEPDIALLTEPRRGEHDNGGDPTNHRNVAQH